MQKKKTQKNKETKKNKKTGATFDFSLIIYKNTCILSYCFLLHILTISNVNHIITVGPN